jgi:hypothetical protein
VRLATPAALLSVPLLLARARLDVASRQLAKGLHQITRASLGAFTVSVGGPHLGGRTPATSDHGGVSVDAATPAAPLPPGRRSGRDLFGQIPDTLEDVWIAVAERENQRALQIIDDMPQRSPFEIRYDKVEAVDWESCSAVLDSQAQLEVFLEGW